MVGATTALLSVLGAGERRSASSPATLIGDPATLGLDALFPAFFLCLLVEGELRPGLPAVVAGLGSLIALVLIPFTPAGVPVIAASAAALIGLWTPPEPSDLESAMTDVWLTIGVLDRGDGRDPRLRPGAGRRPRAAASGCRAWSRCSPRRCSRRWSWSQTSAPPRAARSSSTPRGSPAVAGRRRALALGATMLPVVAVAAVVTALARALF